jgi:hypothetical protein
MCDSASFQHCKANVSKVMEPLTRTMMKMILMVLVELRVYMSVSKIRKMAETCCQPVSYDSGKA